MCENHGHVVGQKSTIRMRWVVWIAVVARKVYKGVVESVYVSERPHRQWGAVGEHNIVQTSAGNISYKREVSRELGYGFPCSLPMKRSSGSCCSDLIW